MYTVDTLHAPRTYHTDCPLHTCTSYTHTHTIPPHTYIPIPSHYTYPRYLEVLLEYLCGYMERVHPLMDQNVLYDEIKRDFEEKWSQGTFPGWRVRLSV